MATPLPLVQAAVTGDAVGCAASSSAASPTTTAHSLSPRDQQVDQQAAADSVEHRSPIVKPNNIRHPVYAHVSTILAPMVRASTLPLRQTVEDFGCDLSYNEEIIDKRLVHARRFANPHYKNVIEYYIGADVASASTTSETKNPNSNSGERKSVFRTTVEERAKNRTIFQLGTCDPDLALRAAETVIADVAGVDVNMGCPKSFSVKGGMGAALLAVPDSAAAIVKKLRDNLPGEKSVTCKIRMNEDLRKTRELVLKCLLAGADAVAVHMRFVPDRPRQPARWPLFGELLRLLKDCAEAEGYGEKVEAAGASNVDGDMMDRDLHELVKRVKTSRPELDLAHPPLIANGDFFSTEQVRCFRNMYPKVPVMIARGAQWNPALFWDIKLPEETVADAEVAVHPGQMKRRPTPTIEDCIRLYVQKCVDCGSSLQEIKWNLVEMVGKCNSALTFAGAAISVKQFTQRVSQTKRLQDVLEIVAGAGGEATCGDHVAKPFCSVATGKMLELGKVSYDAEKHPEKAHTLAYMKEVLYAEFSSRQAERFSSKVKTLRTEDDENVDKSGASIEKDILDEPPQKRQKTTSA